MCSVRDSVRVTHFLNEEYLSIAQPDERSLFWTMRSNVFHGGILRTANFVTNLKHESSFSVACRMTNIILAADLVNGVTVFPATSTQQV